VQAQYVVDPQLSGPSRGPGVLPSSFELSSLLSVYPLMGRAEFVAVPGLERVIFDSLVLSPCTTGICPPSALWALRRDEIRNGFQDEQVSEN
jgi:hypothetical protein